MILQLDTTMNLAEFAPKNEFALCRFVPRATTHGVRPLIGLWSPTHVLPLTDGQESDPTLTHFLDSRDPAAEIRHRLELRSGVSPVAMSEIQLLSPVERQEIWGGGMTYRRDDIDQSSPTLNPYEKMYHAERPFLFFKSQCYNVVGPGGVIRLRGDSQNTIAEPELTAFISASGKVVGYAIGSDVTARDVEQKNCLYINQAKAYIGACAVGPCIRLCSSASLQDSTIRTRVERGSQVVLTGETRVSEVVRAPEDVASWFVKMGLPRYGAAFITGNGVGFPADFTLLSGDRVIHEIDQLGQLVTTVA